MTTKIVDNGPDINHVVLNIFSEGYQAGEQTKFNSDVAKYVAYFFSDAVYSTLKYKINVYSTFLPSVSSGITHLHTAPDCPSLTAQPILNANTYFGAKFDSENIHRAIDILSTKTVYNEMVNAFGAVGTKANYIPVLFCNTPYYGGLDDGDIGLVCMGDANAEETFLHEVGGHILAGVGDEYVSALEETWNCTQTLPVRWVNLFGGAPFAKLQAGQTWYVPTSNCKMNALGQPFCPVCASHIHTGTDRLIILGGGTPPPISVVVVPPPTGPATNSMNINFAVPPKPTVVLLQCNRDANAFIYVFNLYDSTGKIAVQHFQSSVAPNDLVQFSGLTTKTNYNATAYVIYKNGTKMAESTPFNFTTP